MSLDEEHEGQRKFRALVRAQASDADVRIGPLSATDPDHYPATISTAGKAFGLWISADDFADLANKGGAKFRLQGRIREILTSKVVWSYTCATCHKAVPLSGRFGDPVADDAKKQRREHHEMVECEARMSVEGRVAKFLRAHPEAYCDACIAKLLRLGAGGNRHMARNATSALAETNEFRRGAGRCSRCREQRTVIHPVP